MDNDSTDLISSKANTSVARWYAIQVASSCENKVKATLEQRSVTLGVNNRILEIEIPIYASAAQCRRHFLMHSFYPDAVLFCQFFHCNA